MAPEPKWKDEFVGIVKKACELGATDADLQEILGVSCKTLNKWKHDKPGFIDAMLIGKDIADTRIERSLYQKASGYDIEEEQIVKTADGVEVVKVKRHVPADTTAMIFWLKNRKSGKWADRKAIDMNTTHTITQVRTIDPSLLSPDERLLLRQVLTKALPPPDDAEDGEFEEV